MIVHASQEIVGDFSRTLLTLDDKMRRRVLFRVGAFGRQVMRRSFRKRKGPSAPGSPPNRHEWALHGLTTFRVDGADSVTIGPDLHRTRARASAPVPKVLDQGGTTYVRRVRRKRRESIAARESRQAAIEKVRVAPRPFVAPALQKTVTQTERFIEQSRP